MSITDVFLSPGKESVAIEMDDGDGEIVVFEEGYTEVEEIGELDGRWIQLVPKPEAVSKERLHEMIYMAWKSMPLDTQFVLFDQAVRAVLTSLEKASAPLDA